MKHRKTGRKFSRERDQRRALKKTLLSSLIMAEKIKTTEAKAKELKHLADVIISKAKIAKNDVQKRPTVMRQLESRVSAAAAKKITGEFIGRFESRNSGYTRVVKADTRKNDGAATAIIEFV